MHTSTRKKVVTCIPAHAHRWHHAYQHARNDTHILESTHVHTRAYIYIPGHTFMHHGPHLRQCHTRETFAVLTCPSYVHVCSPPQSTSAEFVAFQLQHACNMPLNASSVFKRALVTSTRTYVVLGPRCNQLYATRSAMRWAQCCANANQLCATLGEGYITMRLIGQADCCCCFHRRCHCHCRIVPSCPVPDASCC